MSRHRIWQWARFFYSNVVFLENVRSTGRPKKYFRWRSVLERSKASDAEARIPGWAALSLTVACLASFSACGGGSRYGTSEPKVVIWPATVGKPINTTTEFTAQVTLSNSSNNTTTTTITWYVNGTAGGSSTLGTIGAFSTDSLVGIYTAPAVVPSTTNGRGEYYGDDSSDAGFDN